MTDLCTWCDEVVNGGDWVPIQTMAGERKTHRECALRQAVGGIGHLIAHEYWCTQHGDPDAGLTKRHSALLVDAFVAIIGVDEAVHR
jgi:hypothetical protein